jgi:hypothetical protein
VRISGGAPKVELSTTDREITAHAGAVLLRATADAIGLGPAINAELHLKVRDRGLSEAESILGMTEALALGAKCLDDLETARGDQAQEAMRGFGIPPPQTAGRFLRRFCLGHIGQLNKALRQVLLLALSLIGVGDAVTLDFDSTYVRSRSSRRLGSRPHVPEALRPASTPLLRRCVRALRPRLLGVAAFTPPTASCPSSTSACAASPKASGSGPASTRGSTTGGSSRPWSAEASPTSAAPSSIPGSLAS